MPLADSSRTTIVRSPFPATVLRPPSPLAACSCRHWVHCDCDCHAVAGDPPEPSAELDFLPDEHGLTRWGCASCTPGDGLPHLLGCELIGWSVRVRPS